MQLSSEDDSFTFGVQGFAAEIHCSVGELHILIELLWLWVKVRVTREFVRLFLKIFLSPSGKTCAENVETLSWSYNGAKLFEGEAIALSSQQAQEKYFVRHLISFNHERGSPKWSIIHVHLDVFLRVKIASASAPIWTTVAAVWARIAWSTSAAIAVKRVFGRSCSPTPVVTCGIAAEEEYTLVVQNLTLADSGIYSCEYTSPQGRSRSQSKKFTLEVVGETLI